MFLPIFYSVSCFVVPHRAQLPRLWRCLKIHVRRQNDDRAVLQPMDARHFFQQTWESPGHTVHTSPVVRAGLCLGHDAVGALHHREEDHAPAADPGAAAAGAGASTVRRHAGASVPGLRHVAIAAWRQWVSFNSGLCLWSCFGMVGVLVCGTKGVVGCR